MGNLWTFFCGMILKLGAVWFQTTHPLVSAPQWHKHQNLTDLIDELLSTKFEQFVSWREKLLLCSWVCLGDLVRPKPLLKDPTIKYFFHFYFVFLFFICNISLDVPITPNILRLPQKSIQWLMHMISKTPFIQRGWCLTSVHPASCRPVHRAYC